MGVGAFKEVQDEGKEMRAGLKIVLTEVVGEKNMRERVDENRIENLRAIGVDVEFDNVDYVGI